MTFEEGHPGEWHYFRWPEQMLSWDAYIFRRPLPPLSPKVLHPGIFMNMPGAENRAGMALYLALGKDSLIYNNTLPNACGHVNWYHYHCTGQAVQYDPTDNVAMTTHEWRSLFGNVSLPPKSALVRGMNMAIGVDHTLDLELTIRSLIVPITTGCAALQACLHGGKPTHHVLPDVVNYLGYDPTCTQPECQEVTDALLPTLIDLPAPISASLAITESRLTSPDDDAALAPISVPTSSPLRLLVTFDNGQTKDMTTDARAWTSGCAAGAYAAN